MIVHLKIVSNVVLEGKDLSIIVFLLLIQRPTRLRSFWALRIQCILKNLSMLALLRIMFVNEKRWSISSRLFWGNEIQLVLLGMAKLHIVCHYLLWVQQTHDSDYELYLRFTDIRNLSEVRLYV